MRHRFKKYDDFGDESDIENVGDYHITVSCERCYDCWCILCEDDRLEEDCPGSDYEMIGQFDIFTGNVIE